MPAFPFGHVREIAIAGHTVRALRVTYVGELGWELHVPIAATGEVFDALMAAGKPHGIRPVGYRALESLRLEKGYRAWGSDITPNDTPFEAGLGWAVKLRKNTDFLGRRALETINGAALTKRLAGFTVDDPDVVLLGRETILRNGEPVGYLTSGGYRLHGRTSRSATAMCATPTASATRFLSTAITSSSWRWSRSRRASTCSRSTMRRDSREELIGADRQAICSAAVHQSAQCWYGAGVMLRPVLPLLVSLLSLAGSCCRRARL